MKSKGLIKRADVWRGGEAPPLAQEGIPTGFAALDALLPGGGWPVGALTEILTRHEGIGALRLVMPALVALSRLNQWLAWIAPPYIPYAPALAGMGLHLSRVLLVHSRARTDNLWALEQALRSGTCGAVLAWPQEIEWRGLRRLQLAAKHGQTWGMLFRPDEVACDPSPAALRLKVEAVEEKTLVTILKRRGGWPTGPIQLNTGS
ncbi:MAG: translesion DNA synthesis-associated protein ImuA [Gammaproteobacteria bacterium]